MLLKRMTKSRIAANPIVVPPPKPLPLENTRHLKIRDDALHSTLCDPDQTRQIPHPRLRVGRQHHQHMRVIRQIRETRLRSLGKCLGIFHGKT